MFHYRTHISPKVLPPKSPVLKRAIVTEEQYASMMAKSAGQENAAMRRATKGQPARKAVSRELMERAAEAISENGSTTAQIQAALGVARCSAIAAIHMLSEAGRINGHRAGHVVTYSRAARASDTVAIASEGAA
ncbi:hypothetical protein [Pseudogemmobacter faecipullorum]|uniref:Uncharacterized protein n=1 Tax=Pseudogemmobacter faecipullorum TaxID=2755041 RepID=A0ABS8CQM6_9RHOB|nr:hypothetical protein [Pseudogemmobacter faecipullorum]MCB5411493.1 hypothetical protein [Pseudogemmobacter faecipullorum]